MRRSGIGYNRDCTVGCEGEKREWEGESNGEVSKFGSKGVDRRGNKEGLMGDPGIDAEMNANYKSNT